MARMCCMGWWVALKNKLVDLNNHLFEALERLNDDELKGDALSEEMDRAKAISGIAGQIIANGTLALRAAVAMHEANGAMLLPMLEAKKDDA